MLGKKRERFRFLKTLFEAKLLRYNVDSEQLAYFKLATQIGAIIG